MEEFEFRELEDSVCGITTLILNNFYESGRVLITAVPYYVNERNYVLSLLGEEFYFPLDLTLTCVILGQIYKSIFEHIKTNQVAEKVLICEEAFVIVPATLH